MCNARSYFLDKIERAIALSSEEVNFELELRQISGRRDGAVVEHFSPMQASHQCGPGSIPGLGVKCGLSLLLVLVLAPRGFSPGTPVFPSPQKPTLLNSN